MAIGDRFRMAWEGLNPRERSLVGALGGVVASLVVLGVVYGSTFAVSSIEEDNAEITQVLRDIGRARGRLRQREALQRVADARYATKAPPLGSFVEATASQMTPTLSVREVVDQPEKVEGAYTRRSVRANLPGVPLLSTLKLMESIANTPYPVAIERVQIEHFAAGDAYNVQLGLLAFDRNAAARATADAPARPAGRAGPPAPP